MRLMDALVKALEARGSTVSVLERDRKHQTRVKILDETIEIELREGLHRTEKQFTAADCASAKSPHGCGIARNTSFARQGILFLRFWSIAARAFAKSGRTGKGSDWRTA